MQINNPQNTSYLANTILKDILRLEATADRVSKLEGCIENLLNDELITEQQVYEQNCSIARLFIEEHLGLDPTPKRIKQCVEFIIKLEKN